MPADSCAPRPGGAVGRTRTGANWSTTPYGPRLVVRQPGRACRECFESTAILRVVAGEALASRRFPGVPARFQGALAKAEWQGTGVAQRQLRNTPAQHSGAGRSECPHRPQRDRYRRSARPDHNRLTAPSAAVASADVRSPCRVVDGAIGTTSVQPSNEFLSVLLMARSAAPNKLQAGTNPPAGIGRLPSPGLPTVVHDVQRERHEP